MGIVMVSPLLAIAAEPDQQPSHSVSGDPAFAASDLPLPFGVAVDGFYQKEDYRVANLSVGTPTPPVPLPPLPSGLIQSITNSVYEVNTKIDWWALPMLNFHALLGSLTGNAKVAAAPFGDFNVDYNGINYGGGVTLAGGWHHWFATVTADYTWADVRIQGILRADSSGPERDRHAVDHAEDRLPL